MDDIALRLEYLNRLVARVGELQANSMASLGSGQRPNFVMEPVVPWDIPHPHEHLPPLRSRLIPASVGAAVTIVCLGLTVMLSLVDPLVKP